LVKEIKELEQMEEEQKILGKGKQVAHYYSCKVVKKKVDDYLKYIDFGHCKLDEIIPWRVDAGGDLYNCLKARIYKEKIYPAVVSAMVGTVTKACIGYFATDKGVFHVNKIITPTGLEVVSGSGTIGIQEDGLMPHIHVVVADHTGNAYGGHLFSGTIVKEYVEGFIIKVKGVKFERIWKDKIKGYPLYFIK